MTLVLSKASQAHAVLFEVCGNVALHKLLTHPFAETITL
jgi:hypothetical protein